ncbi:MAG: hypothetical protein ABI353_21125 [Isosphaeraceae bacterium]
MRTCLALILVGLLASCPIVCGTAGAAFGITLCDHAPNGDHDHPASHPVNDDCCACNGALRVDDAPLDLTTPQPDGLPVPSAVLSPSPTAHQWHLTPSTGVMPGLAGCQRTAKVHALLQIFRC